MADTVIGMSSIHMLSQRQWGRLTIYLHHHHPSYTISRKLNISDSCVNPRIILFQIKVLPVVGIEPRPVFISKHTTTVQPGICTYTGKFIVPVKAEVIIVQLILKLLRCFIIYLSLTVSWAVCEQFHWSYKQW